MDAHERAIQAASECFAFALKHRLPYPAPIIHAIMDAKSEAAQQSREEERIACINEIQFLLDEHCATKGEQRALEMAIGKLRARKP